MRTFLYSDDFLNAETALIARRLLKKCMWFEDARLVCMKDFIDNFKLCCCVLAIKFPQSLRDSCSLHFTGSDVSEEIFVDCGTCP